MKNNLLNVELSENDNYTISDVNIPQIIPNIIDDCIVTILENHHTIVLPPSFNGSQFKAWKQKRGGIFSKDVLNFSLNKNQGKYLLVKGPNVHCIIRFISEEEKILFDTLNLVDGKIKDISYMILRNINEGETLICSKLVEEEKELPSNEEIIITRNNKSYDDDPEYHTTSISLFND